MLIKNARFAHLILLLLTYSSSCFAEILSLKGEMSQGGLIIGQAPKGIDVFIDDRKLNLTSDGAFVFGLGRDAPSEKILIWKDQTGTAHKQTLKIKQRDYNIQYIEGVPQQTVNPPKERLDRIRAETALVKSARKTDSTLEYFLESFTTPTDGRITGVYGSQRVYNGTPKRPHYGVDYAAPLGTPVYAPAAGVVTLVHQDMYYSGGTLIVDHGYGVSSTFIHLSEIVVKEGQRFKKGDLIAKVGQGGRSTGPHLDWRVNWYDVRVDPLLVLKLSE